jgi:hypothetical protein
MTYSLLESQNFIVCESICLGDDGNQVDLGVETAHNLNIQRLQRVASWLNEVYAGMDTVVHNVRAVDFILRLKISIKSLLNVLNNGAPRNIIIDEITKSRSVNNC